MLKHIPSKILIYTPIKVGSTTLSHALTQCGYKLAWNNNNSNLDFYYQYTHTIHRGHTWYDPKKEIFDGGKVYDIWFTLVRIPTEIYISSFFQDITIEDFPYYFGTENEILQAKPKELLDLFLSIDWRDYKYCSCDFNFDLIEKYSGVDIWKKDFNKIGYQLYKSHNPIKKVIVIRTDLLSNNKKMQNLFKGLNLKLPPQLNPMNCAKDKWYGEIYKSFKKIIPPEYYKRYQEIDNKIRDKFYEI